MKRLRVRPFRAERGYQYWGIAPDTGRGRLFKALHLGQTPGEVIDRALRKKNRKTTGPVRPSYPEH